ncbi:PREDICTED: ATP-dependent (S)-NAD(P)H-hydrate dehydratase [Ceratosolen solmsi marchali]|uniref:ATP-dependent (S)-NAD(P)H-hydrate dehydratase n=1 Tax=Ceratosolen solmsi marchali TaxID=326594 RepID=A0AAJ6YPF7_9HYME|nr:PREDICTED: ATP-dependent (S)-NAD(P)H-hydrate dehydratase [Ceratosolen solmsi marchali]
MISRRRSFSCLNTNAQRLTKIIKDFLPNLNEITHKGQNGKIGIIGGSVEYTGAPYFAGMSALRVGADLVHIFCCKEASIPIKSYSPELIVHPHLNNGLSQIVSRLKDLHVILIGPGLGRDTNIFQTVSKLIEECRALSKPLVIDADGLFLVSQKTELIRNYPGLILTPNYNEFARLVKAFLNKTIDLKSGIEESLVKELAESIGEDVLVVCKGSVDVISCGTKDVKTIHCEMPGSGRRCGGQGDLLAGSLAVLSYWATSNVTDYHISLMAACYAACSLVRQCNAVSYSKKGRGALTTDLLDEITLTFEKLYGDSSNIWV